MAKQPETNFKEKVWAKLKALYPYVEAEKITQRSKRGMPDFVICAGGLFVVWELKVKKNKADPLQGWKLGRFAAAKGIARVVKPDNLELCLTELKQLAGVPEITTTQMGFKL